MNDYNQAAGPPANLLEKWLFHWNALKLLIDKMAYPIWKKTLGLLQ